MPVSLPKPNVLASSTSGSRAWTSVRRSRSGARTRSRPGRRRCCRRPERLREADGAVGAGLVVLEAAVADLEGRGAVQPGVGREPWVSAPAVINGFHVEPGANWPWVARREQRGAGLLGVEVRQLGLGDAADPDARVVRRLAGHRDHAPGLRLEHDGGAGVGDVVAVPVTGSGVARAVLIVRASCRSTTAWTLASIEVTRVSPGLLGDLAVVAQHAAHRVDGDPLVAGHAAQPAVVGLLDAGPADLGGAVDGDVGVLLGGVELVLGDRAEVAEQVRGVDAVRLGVGAHRLLGGHHGGVVLGLLEDPQRDLLLDVGGDRDRLVGRAVPARAADTAGVTAVQQPLADPGRALVHDRRVAGR